jgi:hypothetical protein
LKKYCHKISNKRHDISDINGGKKKEVKKKRIFKEELSMHKTYLG